MIVMFLVYRDVAGVSGAPAAGLVGRHVRANREVLAERATVLAVREPDPAAWHLGADPLVDPVADADAALAGFFVVDCPGMDDAIELARAFELPAGVGRVELRSVTRTWDYAPSLDTPAGVETLWRLYSDVSTWPLWKAGVRHVRLDGPFETGAGGWLSCAGQSPLRFLVVEAKENERYVSETELADDVTLRMEHYLTPLPGGGTRMTNRATIPGAAADTFGLNSSAEFNAGMRATLRQLSAHAVALQAA